MNAINNKAPGEGGFDEAPTGDYTDNITALVAVNQDVVSEGFGAFKTDWDTFDLLHGLTADLLPCVSDPSATISPDSTMKTIGKTPSRYNGKRHVAGFSDWTNYKASIEDINKWSKEPNYGICIQTRHLRAIDVDVTDSELAEQLRCFLLEKFAQPTPIRKRANASKFLIAFYLEGTYGKRIITTSAGNIEALMGGQQFVAAGTHPSGSRYEWEGGLPADFPTLTSAEFEQLWSQLAKEFAIVPSTTSSTSNKVQKMADVVSSDPVAQYLLDKHLVKSTARDGKMLIDCPWKEDHSMDSGDTETCYYPAHTGGFANGHFKCLHAHCEAREDHEYLDKIGYAAADALADFEAISGAKPIETSKDGKPSSRFALVPAHEFAVLPESNYWIDDVIPAAELMVVYGASTAGKTFMVLDMAIAVARGVEWRGHHVKKGRVVYIAAEGVNGVRKRLMAYAKHHKVDLATIPLFVIETAPNFINKVDALEVAKQIGPDASLVIIDTYAAVMQGGDENSGQDGGHVITNCKGIHKATGATVILIHHSGKDASKGARGWSGLRAAADAEAEVIRNGDARALSITKQKDGEDGAEFGFKLVPVVIGEDARERAITSCVVQYNIAAAAISRTPQGPTQKAVMETFKELLIDDSTGVGMDALIQAMIAKTPRGTAQRDKRRENLLRTIDNLEEANFIRTKGGCVFYPDALMPSNALNSQIEAEGTTL